MACHSLCRADRSAGSTNLMLPFALKPVQSRTSNEGTSVLSESRRFHDLGLETESVQL